MTVYAWARPAALPHAAAARGRASSTSRPTPGCWRTATGSADRRAHPTVLLLHGLEGSSDAHYMRGIADKAWARGFNVVRLNQRNCGGTEHLSRGLYHSGLTADPRFVLTELRDRDGLTRFAVAGYSLGGNLAHEARRRARRDGPAGGASVLRRVAGHRARGVRAGHRAAREPHLRVELLPQPAGPDAAQGPRLPRHVRSARLWKVWSIRAFDERYTAPHHGFDGASDYYHRASAMRVIDRVARPALILSAADDPFVPPDIFAADPLRGNPHITTIVTSHGGHCAFVEAPTATTATGPSERWWTFSRPTSGP